jgi:creatinine amidohydrolase
VSSSDLGRATWPEVDGRIVIVPVGSCEQHGPHLPLHTDTVIATALARRLAAVRADCIVTPPLAITASGEHQGFPGTLSIGTEAMVDVLVEIVRSAGWSPGVVFVNGHGGNAEAMRRAADIADHEGRSMLVWWPRPAAGDPHAGHLETSLMLALAPDDVRLDRAVAGPVPPLDELVRHGVLACSPSGVLGDPTSASADEGRRILEELVAQLVAAVADWSA